MPHGRRYWVGLLNLFTIALFAAGCTRQARQSYHYNRAERYYARGQFNKAEIEYLSALQLGNTQPHLFEHMGSIYFNRGSPRQALPFLLAAKQLDPNNVEVRLKLGRILQLAGKFPEARQESLFILERYPTNQDAVLLLVDCAITPKDATDALQRLTQLRQKAGDHAVYHLAEAGLLFRQQKIPAGEGELNRAQVMDPKLSEVYLAWGGIYWASNDLPRADQAFQKAADLASWKAPRLVQYANFKLKTGKTAEAKKLLTDLAKADPDYLPAWNHLAQIALAEKDYTECTRCLNRILSHAPSDYDALSLRARMKLAQGKAAEGLAEYTRLSTLYTNVPQVRYDLAVAALAAGDAAQALKSLQRAVALQPLFPEAVVLLADMRLRRGDPDGAINSLIPFIKQRPDVIPAQLTLANAYRAKGALDSALAIYRRLMEAFPRNPQPPYLAGVVLREQNKRPEARVAFQKALDLAPDNLTPLEQLVDLDLLDQQYNSALQRVQKVADKYPKSPLPALLTAKIYFAQRAWDQSEATLQKAIQLDPNLRASYMLLAQVYVAAKRYPQAIEKLKGLIAKNPKDLSALLQLGMIYDLIKDYPAARDTYEAVLRVNPEFPIALNNLAYLYSEQFSQLDKAYAMARKAHDLNPADPATADTLGWITYKRGDYAAALALLRESADSLPQSEVLAHLGMAQYMLGQESAARTSFERALQTKTDFPGKAEAQHRLALLNLDVTSGDPKVLAGLQAELTQRPNDPIVLVRLAAASERAGAFDKARDAYEKVLQANPKDVGAAASLAQLYLQRLHAPAQALALAKRARTLAPDDVGLAQRLGRIGCLAGDPRWALGLLQESARRYPTQPDVLYDLAFCYFDLDQPNDALATLQALPLTASTPAALAARRLQSALALYTNPVQLRQSAVQVRQMGTDGPQGAPALMLQGMLDELQGAAADAQRVYLQILDQLPGCGPATKRLAILYAATPGDDRRAYESLTKARELFPNDAALVRSLGVVLFRRGDFIQAVRLLGESAQKGPADPDVFYYLGMAHYQLKDRRECADALRRALALNLDTQRAAEAKRVLAELR